MELCLNLTVNICNGVKERMRADFEAYNLCGAYKDRQTDRQSFSFSLETVLCLVQQCFVGRDSSVGTATAYGLDGRGFESRWGPKFAPADNADNVMLHQQQLRINTFSNYLQQWNS